MLAAHRHRRATACRVLVAVTGLALPLVAVGVLSGTAQAASSKACIGGGYRVLGQGPGFEGSVPAPSGAFVVAGRHTRFTVDPATFAVRDQGFTGAPNELDQTGGRPTTVYASKLPNHRGLRLTSTITLSLDEEGLVMRRTGPGLSMKLQAKDCAVGGIFQMEPSRADGTRTRIVHRLATGVFYYDNPRFRARIGQYLGSACTSVTTGPPSRFCVQVRPRVNIGRDGSPDLVLRDSAQVATRVPQPECGPDFTNAFGLAETRDHCGGMSIWDVASGGRMGMVTGEDAVEVSNPPTTCTQDCQAQNQVRGRLTVLGSPAVVPAGSRLAPRTSTQGLSAPLTR